MNETDKFPVETFHGRPSKGGSDATALAPMQARIKAMCLITTCDTGVAAPMLRGPLCGKFQKPNSKQTEKHPKEERSKRCVWSFLLFSLELVWNPDFGF
ncbi:MAG TPA: hypothetical protein VGR35_04830 [Tepidisphaeraceae bacterium]|nr:hypothetical protein [Tepidisphaeraceae bacterium]